MCYTFCVPSKKGSRFRTQTHGIKQKQCLKGLVSDKEMRSIISNDGSVWLCNNRLILRAPLSCAADEESCFYLASVDILVIFLLRRFFADVFCSAELRCASVIHDCILSGVSFSTLN